MLSESEYQKCILEKTELAMKLIVEWRKMRTFCQNRSTCEGCPYKHRKECDAVSTEVVLEKAADTFNEYLINKK